MFNDLPIPVSIHYFNRYKKLIEYYIKLDLQKSENYTELHHILPRCYGGDDDINNLVRLPARVHYLAHWLLYKAYNERKVAYAFIMMHASSNRHNRYINSRYYQYTKENISNLPSIWSGENNNFYGKHHSEETKKVLSEKLKGKTQNKKPISDEQRKIRSDRMRNYNLQRKRS